MTASLFIPHDKVEELVREMNTIFIHSLLSVQKIMINDKHCFELYGYDILIDTDLKPMTGKEKRVGGFDLMWDDGPVFAEEAGLDCVNPPSYSTNTFLGCYNDRKKQLRSLFKQIMTQKIKAGS
ncbi:putative tubulin polyglutamylase TTLL9 isoform X2 [Apostichopus japonicus]|uniref:Tubulin--tyrosine ligase-like protein 9 n=1 Tax=Stichopus japonicus TaxID=307972 RepID=A0A2G8KXT6_STIJA|nr:putative tubulin polyglutamylase TTLL9 isoform X2 [Apostichopus japonicus]